MARGAGAREVLRRRLVARDAVGRGRMCERPCRAGSVACRTRPAGLMLRLMACRARRLRQIVALRTGHLHVKRDRGLDAARRLHAEGTPLRIRRSGLQDARLLESGDRDLVSGLTVALDAVRLAGVLAMREAGRRHLVRDVGVAAQAPLVGYLDVASRELRVARHMDPQLLGRDHLVGDVVPGAGVHMAVDTVRVPVSPCAPGGVEGLHLMAGVAEGGSFRGLERRDGGEGRADDTQQNRQGHQRVGHESGSKTHDGAHLLRGHRFTASVGRMRRR